MTAQITENLVFETCLCASEMHGKIYYCQLANAAWQTYQGEHPDCAGSADFAKGFKRGYADYLEKGGDCCLNRPRPPMRYMKVRYETPEGRAATVAWLDGFRAGATAAKASGYRELIVLPVGRSNHPPELGPPMAPIAPPLGNGAVIPVSPPTPASEELPAPRTVPDTQLPPPPPKVEG